MPIPSPRPVCPSLHTSFSVTLSITPCSSPNFHLIWMPPIQATFLSFLRFRLTILNFNHPSFFRAGVYPSTLFAEGFSFSGFFYCPRCPSFFLGPVCLCECVPHRSFFSLPRHWSMVTGCLAPIDQFPWSRAIVVLLRGHCNCGKLYPG